MSLVTRINGYKTPVANSVTTRLLLIVNNFVTVKAVAKRSQNCLVSTRSLAGCKNSDLNAGHKYIVTNSHFYTSAPRVKEVDTNL